MTTTRIPAKALPSRDVPLTTHGELLLLLKLPRCVVSLIRINGAEGVGGMQSVCVEWHRSLRMDYNAGSSIIIMPYVLFPTATLLLLLILLRETSMHRRG